MDVPEPVLPDLDRLARVLVAVRRGFDDADYWGARNNPDCEDNVATLLRSWRRHARPVVFVRHDSSDPRSPVRPGQPGHDLQPALTGEPDLLVN